MFSLYGVSGRVFRGSLEQLRQIGPVSRVSRTQAIEPLGIDGRDGPADLLPFQYPTQPPPPMDVAHRIAVDSYTQTQKAEQQRQPVSRVETLMSPKVITLPDTATVLQAWQLLAREGVGQAPVISAAAVLVGLVSRADLMSQERLGLLETDPGAWRALMAQPVTEIMWSPVPSVSPQADIRRVASVLLETGLPGLPVVDEEGAVVGFISRSDILRAVTTDPPLDLWG